MRRTYKWRLRVTTLRSFRKCRQDINSLIQILMSKLSLIDHRWCDGNAHSGWAQTWEQRCDPDSDPAESFTVAVWDSVTAMIIQSTHWLKRDRKYMRNLKPGRLLDHTNSDIHIVRHWTNQMNYAFKTCNNRIFGHLGAEQQAVNTILAYYHLVNMVIWQTRDLLNEGSVFTYIIIITFLLTDNLSVC